MNKQVIPGTSILWAAAILATAMLVKESPNAFAVILILSSCATMSLMIMGGSCRRLRDRAST